MNILFIHPNFPGQFLYLAEYLAKNPENKVMFLAAENASGGSLPGVQLVLYAKPAEEAEKLADKTGPCQTMMKSMLTGLQVVKALQSIRKQTGFVPDVIVGHTGWGSLLYVKDLYPDVPVLGYVEWFYHAVGGDSYYWPDEVPSLDAKVAIRTKDASHLLSLESIDAAYTPTHWQHSQFPARYQEKIEVCHDGIHTAFCSPLPKRPGLVLEDAKLSLPEGSEILTYVSRGFEAFRGFPYFMDAVRLLLKRRPQLHVVIVGTDRICYGAQLKDTSYLKEERKKGIDETRVHFVGHRSRPDYQKILRASSCHVYLTRPFILSWSMLEAMSFGCPLVASKTPPCEEVVEDGVNGLLAEFRSPHHIARRVEELLDDRALAERLGRAARETVLERYELTKCLHRQEDMIYRLLK